MVPPIFFTIFSIHAPVRRATGRIISFIGDYRTADKKCTALPNIRISLIDSPA